MLQISDPIARGQIAGAAVATSALIIQFPASRPLVPRFTTADRTMLMDHRRQGSRIADLDVAVTVDQEFGEFASFTPRGQWWSAWNVAPQQGSLLLWNGVRGVDLGLFDNMCCVFNTLDLILLAASSPAMQPSTRHAPRPHLGKPRVNGSAAHGCSCAVQCARLSLAS